MLRQPRRGQTPALLRVGALLLHQTLCPHLSLRGGTEPQASDLWWWSQGFQTPPLGAMVCHIHMEWPQEPREAPWALPGASTGCLHLRAQRLWPGRPPLAAFKRRSCTTPSHEAIIAGCQSGFLPAGSERGEIITRDLQGIYCGRSPRATCDTESVTKGMGASLHPLPRGEHGMGLEGTWGSWERALGHSMGRKRTGAAGASPQRGQGGLPRRCLPFCQGCHHSRRIGPHQTSAAGIPQNLSSSHTPLGDHHGVWHHAGRSTRDTSKCHPLCPRLPELPLSAKRTFSHQHQMQSVLFLLKKAVLIEFKCTLTFERATF